MEDSVSQHTEATPIEQSNAPVKPRRRISILSVAWRFAVALGILGGGLYFALGLIKSSDEPPRRSARERSFTVATVPAEIGTYSPKIQAYGEIVAGRSIDVRAQVSGEILEVAPNLVAGGQVRAGELLVRFDSFAYDGALTDAQASLADSRLQLVVAQEQLQLEQINLDAARQQLELASRDLERAKTLLASGSVTNKSIEDRELLVSQRTQTLSQRESSVRVQQSTIDRQTTAIVRAEWTLQQAQRALDNTEIRAPFNGVVVSTTAGVGRISSNNEVVAQLYESDKLEARFTLSDQQYGLLASEGVVGRAISAIWNIDPTPISATGKIVRAGAEINASLGGVEVYAEVAEAAVGSMRPGTFVEIEVEGLQYSNSILLPETAIYENDHFYVVRDGRMANVPLEILARDGDNTIVRAEVVAGEEIITTRVAQAGDGLLVTIEGAEETISPTGRPQSAGVTTGEAAAGNGNQRPNRVANNGERPARATGQNGAPRGDGRPAAAASQAGAGQ